MIIKQDDPYNIVFNCKFISEVFSFILTNNTNTIAIIILIKMLNYTVHIRGIHHANTKMASIHL